MSHDRERRARVCVFLALLFAYGYFHQGGGWNQNVRLDQARSLVETGSFAIDDYLYWVVEATPSGKADTRRLRLSDPDVRTRRLAQVNSYDLSEFGGHFYPTKPPGVSLMAALAYAPLYTVERWLGVDPDRWRPLTVNAWAVTLLVVALPVSLGGVAFFTTARRLFPDAGIDVAVWATLAMGLATQMFPYATMMMDHGPVCAAALSAFALLVGARFAPVEPPLSLFVTAGLLAGATVLMNHAAVLIVAPLLGYVLLALRSRRALQGFAAGGVVPSALLVGYQAWIFGHPFALPSSFQLDFFVADSAKLLGSFEWPRAYLLPDLMLLPYRGLLFWSPVLSFAGVGLVLMARRQRVRPELLVIATVGLLYVILNISFSRWHGGAAVGPRYMTPAVPFLALALVPAFARLPRLALAVGAVSAGLMLLATAVNPMVPGRYANPLTDYYLPLARGEVIPEGFYELQGPVSVNPVGFASTDLEIFAPDGRFVRWNAFNLGELLFPGSWASLLPLALAEAAVLLWLHAPRRRRPPD